MRTCAVALFRSALRCVCMPWAAEWCGRDRGQSLFMQFHAFVLIVPRRKNAHKHSMAGEKLQSELATRSEFVFCFISRETKSMMKVGF